MAALFLSILVSFFILCSSSVCDNDAQCGFNSRCFARCSLSGTRYGNVGQKARGPFLESPIINGPVKLYVVYMQDRGFNSFLSNVIKPWVSETKCTIQFANKDPRSYSIWIYDFRGPKSYRDFRETCPRTGIKVNDFVARDQAPQWGKKGKKRGQKGKISANETGPAVLFPPQTTSSPECRAWSQAKIFDHGMVKSVTPDPCFKECGITELFLRTRLRFPKLGLK